MHDKPSSIIEQDANEQTLDAPSNPYDSVRYNALTHGILSKNAVLPHEDKAEFNAVLTALQHYSITALQHYSITARASTCRHNRATFSR